MLLVFSLGLLGILINFVLPNFAEFYQTSRPSCRSLTVVLIGFSKFVRAYWYVWSWLDGRRPSWPSSSSGAGETTRLWLERQKLRMPLGKLIWVESGVSLFSRTLSLLLAGRASRS